VRSRRRRLALRRQPPLPPSGQGQVIGNRYNWRALPRALLVIRNPFRLFLALVQRRALAELSVRTPTGPLRLELRNFESLKTLYSIFCREDYPVSKSNPHIFIDIGANIGLASAYFLSRNVNNSVICFEPDSANLDYLTRNLATFAGRTTIVERAVATQAGATVLYQSADGKHSSLVPSALAQTPQPVFACSFAKVLRRTAQESRPTVVKLDVEGMELELVRSVSFLEYRHVHRLICDHQGIAAWVERPHCRTLRSGYVDDLSFES